MPRVEKSLGATKVIHGLDLNVEDEEFCVFIGPAGRIEQAGSPATLYGDPDNVFVAGFIGSPKMNLLDATANADGSVTLADTKLSANIEQKLAADGR